MGKNYRLYAFICAMMVCSVLCFGIMAWNEPITTPPADNVAAPINTGADAQYKTGDLGVKIGGAITYWISQVGNNLVFKTGDDFATAVETVNISTDGRISNVAAPIGDKDVVNKAYLDALSGGSDGGTGYDGTCTGTILDLRFTVATYNGNLGGIAGAEAKCAAEYPGYHFCQYAELRDAGLTGCLPIVGQYSLVSGWYNSVKAIFSISKPSTCNGWTSSVGTHMSYLFANYGYPGFPEFAGGWISEDGGVFGTNYDYCSGLHSLACCKQ